MRTTTGPASMRTTMTGTATKITAMMGTAMKGVKHNNNPLRTAGNEANISSEDNNDIL